MWIGACTSSIGTWMQILAQSWLVYKLSNSSVYLGLDAFFGQIPIFLFSLFGGVFADRRSRKTLLLISQIALLIFAFVFTQQLVEIIALHIMRLLEHDLRPGPVAVGAKADIAQDRVERVGMDVRRQLVLVQRPRPLTACPTTCISA